LTISLLFDCSANDLVLLSNKGIGLPSLSCLGFFKLSLTKGTVQHPYYRPCIGVTTSTRCIKYDKFNITCRNLCSLSFKKIHPIQNINLKKYQRYQICRLKQNHLNKRLI